MEKIKWAIVGIGTAENPASIWRSLGQFKAMSYAEIVAVIAHNSKYAREFQRDYFPRALPGDWADLQEYLDEGKVQAVCLLAPLSIRRELAMDAITCGAKAIVCEGLIAHTLEDFIEVGRLALKEGVLLVVANRDKTDFISFRQSIEYTSDLICRGVFDSEFQLARR